MNKRRGRWFRSVESSSRSTSAVALSSAAAIRRDYAKGTSPCRWAGSRDVGRSSRSGLTPEGLRQNQLWLRNLQVRELVHRITL